MFSRVFISYRRADFGGHANLIVDRIREHLAAHYGSQGLFLDTHSIPAGADFEAEVSASISIASAVIAVVGPDWCNEIIKRRGQVDHVLVELKCALSLGVPIVPLLAEGVSMPSTEVLTRETVPSRGSMRRRLVPEPHSHRACNCSSSVSSLLLKQLSSAFPDSGQASARTSALASRDFISATQDV